MNDQPPRKAAPDRRAQARRRARRALDSVKDGAVSVRRRLPFGDRFRLGLEDKRAPISVDMESESGTLLVAFGGMAGKLDIPPFEFFSLTGGMPVKRVFVRDLRRSWYHRGVPRHGATIPEVGQSLRALLAGHEVDRVVVAGTSAGGYAALLFGAMLEADEVLSFGPQSTLDLDALAEMGDHRWDEQVRGIAATGDLDSRWTDLRTALPRVRAADTRLHVYYDAGFGPDRVHAERLGGLEGVSLHGIEGGDHRVARKMRESGELERALRAALGLPQEAAATGPPS